MENKNTEMFNSDTSNEKSSIGSFMGALTAKVIVICFASLILTGVVALTVKAIQGLLLWLF